MSSASTYNLKLAERGVWVSISAYIALSIGQMVAANLFHSSSLQANAFNNLTDIMGNIAILVGLRIARIPADDDHVYGHWKVESIASLISSFIMFFVGFEVLRETVIKMMEGSKEAIDPLGALVGLSSAAIMIFVYLYTRKLAKKTQSEALMASSKDNLSDAVTSLGTAIAIGGSALGWLWLDELMAIVICGFILKTAYEIFRDSVFRLSDGFDEKLVRDYTEAIQLVSKVKNVKMVRGRSYGSNIFLDVIVEMSPDLSVFESHEATEKIERVLMDGFDVYDVDVHVEPCQLPTEEQFASRALELLHYEEQFLNHEQLEELTAYSFKEIAADGSVSNYESKSKLPVLPDRLAISNYESRQVSKKTFILTYNYWQDGENFIVSSTWRRNQRWYCIYRQITKKSSQN